MSDGNISEVIDIVGAKKLSAERVAGRAISTMKRYIDSGAAVGEYLCDQLLLPLALGNGGRFTTIKPSLHSETNIDVIKEFVDCDIAVTEIYEDLFEITVTK